MKNNKKKILLISLNIEKEYSLALYYLKLFTLKNKELSRLIDITILEFELNIPNKKIVIEILNHKPDFIGFSCNIWNMERVLMISKIIKIFLENVPLIFGGQEVTNSYIDYMSLYSFIDIIVDGEGEITFFELLKDFIGTKFKNLDKIDGIKYRKNNKIYKNNPRPPLENLDLIPSPYLNDSILLSDNLHLGAMLELTRGCPNKCSFCFEASNFKTARSFSSERIKNEIKHLFKKGIKKFHFLDPIIACGNLNRLKDLNEIFETTFNSSKDYFIPVEIYAEYINENNIEYFKNFNAYDIGLQTINPEVQENINRKFNIEKFEKGFNLLKTLNNETVIYLILGLPGDDFLSVINSIKYVVGLKPTFFHLNYLYILNGIPMRKDIEKFKILFCTKPPYEIISNKTFSQNELKIARVLGDVTTKQFNLNLDLFQHK